MTLTDFFGLTGYLGLTSAFIVCISLILLSLILHVRANPALERFARLLTHTQTFLLGLAVLSLGVLLQKNAFAYETVFNAVEATMPFFERLGGLWSGQASSLLFWSFVMSSAASLSVLLAKRIPSASYTPSVLLVFEVTLVFFILPDVFFSNPFHKTWLLPSGAITPAVFAPADASLLVPVDGQGMNPSLRHIAMLLHPPTLYLGLIGFFIPYAFALASLLKGDEQPTWIGLVFPLVRTAWIFLTIGMLLGSWWAYTILGWGGYWGWDAVEISGLLPWLLSFGLVHSFAMQLRGRPYRRWLYSLSFTIVILILFGIFITRSGILESVHAYTSGTMGPVLTSLVALHLLAVIGLLVKRRHMFAKQPSQPSASYPDRLVRLFNACLVGLVLIYLFGQTLPLTSQLFLGEKNSFAPLDYEFYSAPLLLALVILTALFPLAHLKDTNPRRFKRSLVGLLLVSALCPLAVLFFAPLTIYAVLGFWAAAFLLSSWLYALVRDVLLPFLPKRKKKAARSKGMSLGALSLCIHLGFAVMALGILGVENLSATHDVRLRVGEEITLAKHTFSGHFQQNYVTKGGIVRFAFGLTVISPGASQRKLVPLIEHYPKLKTLHAQPAIAAGFLQDVQVVMSQRPNTLDGKAALHITFFPLMSWIWAGGVLMAFGGLLALCVRKH